MSALEDTSVPAWCVTPTTPAVDTTGRHYTVVSVGPGASTVTEAWLAALAPLGAEAVRCIPADDGESAIRSLGPELARARVGWRLLIAGPADACLALRAAALSAGVEDDEMVIASTRTDGTTVYCAHCGTCTPSDASIDDTVTCAGCRRGLLVFPHVARRTGSYLGFMADAEVPAR
ncbi:dimethylamine monooxygenase subunit DmmA family protein [Streptomyces sp. NPDC002928]|uniref:dimethylamine monooxygenase subunit DmmA family protein n=1 Tax=Streptomyces sp. NPDC002928 TaxID=3154440 RepID=UPI0033B0D559